ncbi:MAG: PD-(D/E)XK nuclease family protein [Thermoplasmata archaeon]|nr:PD-(D/E)XK nuclease family protein [Thermoplasmata archaeon]
MSRKVVNVEEAISRAVWRPPAGLFLERATEYAVGEKVLLGSALHTFLSIWRIGQEKPKDVVERLSYLPEEIVEEVVEAAETLLASSFMNLYESLLERGFKVLKEVPLSFIENGRVFQGRADLVMLGEDELFLFDYKYTGGDKGELVERYGRQIELYSEALRRAFPGREIHPYLVLVPGGELVDMTLRTTEGGS